MFFTNKINFGNLGNFVTVGDTFISWLIFKVIVIFIYYTSVLNECLTSDAFNSASGEAASALTSHVKHSFSPRV
jgi:hypothetical protein